MKRKSLILVLLLLVFSSIAYSEAVIITLTTPKLLWNHSVGSSWGYSAKFDEDGIDDEQDYLAFNKPVGLSIQDRTLILQVFAMENDSSPDIGRNKIEIPISEITSEEREYSCLVEVVEDRGRYAGSSAGWEFKVKARLGSVDTLPEPASTGSGEIGILVVYTLAH